LMHDESKLQNTNIRKTCNILNTILALII
jgi:hypothetical protein